MTKTSTLFDEWMLAEHLARDAEQTLHIENLSPHMAAPDAEELNLRVGLLRARASGLLREFVGECAVEARRLRG